MKISKKKVIPTLALIGLTTLGAASVSAAEIAKTAQRPKLGEHAPHRHEFKELLEGLTDEQKEALEEAHQLRREGRYPEAVQLIRDAGIVLPVLKDPEQHKERKKKLNALIESNDYEAFRRMVADTPMADIIDTQEKFEALVESHSLREEGKLDEAREVLEDIGIKPPQRFVHTR